MIDIVFLPTFTNVTLLNKFYKTETTVGRIQKRPMEIVLGFT